MPFQNIWIVFNFYELRIVQTVTIRNMKRDISNLAKLIQGGDRQIVFFLTVSTHTVFVKRRF